MITGRKLIECMPECPREKADLYASLLSMAMAEREICTLGRVAPFLGQLRWESLGLSALVENLNYSAVQLMHMWPTRFATEQVARAYEHQPERIANRAYGGRGGNGDESSGDGWRYRGRGWIHPTLKDNYRALGMALGVDLVATPDLAAEPQFAAKIAAAYWTRAECNALADAFSYDAITRAVNGPAMDHHIDRLAYTCRCFAVLGGGAPVIEPAAARVA
jgi:putative chitinase